MKKAFLYATLFLIISELCVRFAFHLYYPRLSIVAPDFMRAAYPELARARPVIGRCNILILGESPTESPAFAPLVEKAVESQSSQKVTVRNLSRFANMTIDSYYKLATIHEPFDIIVVSHGVSDCRMNYSFSAELQNNYNFNYHYKILSLFFAHKESKYFVLPLGIHIGWVYIIKVLNGRFDCTGRIPSEAYKNGEIMKTQRPFRKNIENIVRLAESRNERVVLFPITTYIPDNYSAEAFSRHALDYATFDYPVETYGQPDQVKRFLKVHLQSQIDQNVPICLLDEKIPKNRLYFKDMCHLTDSGMTHAASELAAVIAKELSSDFVLGRDRH